jgi:hypothetical protein
MDTKTGRSENLSQMQVGFLGQGEEEKETEGVKYGYS